MIRQRAERVCRIPPYVFADIERKVSAMKKSGRRIISFGIGDPDLPPPDEFIAEIVAAVKQEKYHKYSPSEGEMFFKEAVAEWYGKRFGVDIDPAKNVCALIGSKEGLANLARAYVNPGDSVLVPDPAYPVYANGAATLCDGNAVSLPLYEDSGFLPDLSAVIESADTAKKPTLLYLNYPNNPTGAVADADFLAEAVEFADRNDLLIAYDNAYSEVTYGDFRAPSILQVKNGIEHAVEFHSLSKTFNVTGDRLGFAVGNENAVSALKHVKAQLDSGPAPYVQAAGAAALRMYKGHEPPIFVRERNEIWRRRLMLISKRLDSLGYKCRVPRGTFYLFVNIGMSSMHFTEKLLELGIVVTPGIGFGEFGEGYVRFAATQTEEAVNEAFDRIENSGMMNSR